MERVLSQDERIRRAEELYARRKLEQIGNRSATVNVENVKENKYTKKLIIQFIICLILYGSIYAIRNSSNFLPQNIIYKISDVLEYDINVNELWKKFNEYINIKDEKVEEIIPEADGLETSESVQETLVEETLSASENIENQEQKQESQVTEECSSMSQMELDALYIKENCSIVKPLTGEITSRFGIRESTASIVSPYHTGIDIAEVTGTVICAAMDGTVTVSSSEGAYGNHIKITNGEVSTLYAHCSKLYVKEGENIVQGQKIAEVGQTGNATGPHLHFEILRNDQLVDPDLILDF